MLLNVEYDPDGEVIINLDQEGLDMLKRNLKQLEDKPNHVHLFAPSWAGHELTEEEPAPGCALAYKLTLRKVPS